MTKNYEYDASKYVLGRLASEVSVLLQGKNLPSYQPNLCPNLKVRIFNADDIKTTGKKRANKIYHKYTGYTGHLKKLTLEQKLVKDSREVIRLAVKNMLPKNKLRHIMMKNLQVYKKEIV